MVIAEADYPEQLRAAFAQLTAAALPVFSATSMSEQSRGGSERTGGQASAPPAAPVPASEAPRVPPWVKPGGVFGSRATGFWQRPVGGSEVARYQPRPKTDARALESWIALRDTYMTLIEAEGRADTPDGDLDRLRGQLGRCYDEVVAVLGQPLNAYQETVSKNGTISRRYPPIGGARMVDPDYFAVLALERYDPDTRAATTAPIFDSRQIRRLDPVTHSDQIEDALAVSLAETGSVDLDRITALLGVTLPEVVDRLKGHAFEDPETRRWVPAAVYLSGDVRAKRAVAAVAAADDARFTGNVAALDAVVPADVSPEDISVQLGVPWLTPDEITQFLRDTLDNPLRECEISYHSEIGWSMQFPSYLEHGETITGTYGTRSMSALRITAAALAGRPIRVYQSVDRDGREVRILDRAATIEANAKLDDLNTALANWIRSDPLRASELTHRYNTLFRSLAPPTYPPSWPRPPGLAAGIELRAHQSAAVFRAVMSPAVGLFHAVGAGKTITMASVAMELRRLGLAQRPLLVVPNHLVEQIAADFHRAYPGARVLLPDDRSARGRANLVSRVASGDWDTIVFSYELFKAIPVSTGAEIAYLDQRSDDLRAALRALSERRAERGGRRGTAKAIEKVIARFEERIKDLRDKPRDPTLTFEALGIDALLCDEAHHVKNLVLADTNQAVAGKASQRAVDLDLKLQLLRRASPDRCRVVLSTGTPVSNSFAELWVMMRYLQPDVLAQAGIGRFDEFVAQFARAVTEVELQPTGEFRLTSRLAEFRNVPDLQLLFAQTADVRMADDLDLTRPRLAGGTRQRIVVPANAELDDFVATLARRAEQVTYRASDTDRDNMLAIYSDGRAAALSLQLVGRHDPTPSKLDLAAEQIHATWLATRHTIYLDPTTGHPHPRPGALQLVFMDQGVPDSKSARGVNLYEQLRQRLAGRGMPVEGIVFIHEARDPEKLYEQCREGRYAVLVGSTSKMGTGMNVQTRAVSLIHMDPTWRPADIEQREGRILRQGNQNPEVAIYNMVAQGSTDALMYQGLERKARMISQVLTGTNTTRTVNDVDAALVHYGDMKALATGNPLVAEHLELKRRVDDLEIRHQAWNRRRARLHTSRPAWHARIEQLTPRLAGLHRLAADRATLDLGGWPITCHGQTVTNTAHADRLLRTGLHRIPHTRRTTGDQPPEPLHVGTIGPWPVHAIRDWTTVTFTIDATTYGLVFEVQVGEEDLLPGSEARIWQRIIHRPLRGLAGAIEDHQDELRRLQSDLTQANQDADSPFPQQGELDDLRARLADVEERLMPTGDPPSQPAPSKRGQEIAGP